jgi:predicted DNA-binding transcriptional regulator AlpA
MSLDEFASNNDLPTLVSATPKSTGRTKRPERSSRPSGRPEPPITASRLLAPFEVAQITGLSVETLAQWRSQKRGIPYIKIAHNCVRYRQADLDLWVSERMVHLEADDQSDATRRP